MSVRLRRLPHERPPPKGKRQADPLTSFSCSRLASHRCRRRCRLVHDPTRPRNRGCVCSPCCPFRLILASNELTTHLSPSPHSLVLPISDSNEHKRLAPSSPPTLAQTFSGYSRLGQEEQPPPVAARQGEPAGQALCRQPQVRRRALEEGPTLGLLSSISENSFSVVCLRWLESGWEALNLMRHRL